MTEAFVNRLRNQVSLAVHKSLREQHAQHSSEYVEGLVDFEMEQLADWIFTEYTKSKEKP